MKGRTHLWANRVARTSPWLRTAMRAVIVHEAARIHAKRRAIGVPQVNERADRLVEVVIVVVSVACRCA